MLDLGLGTVQFGIPYGVLDGHQVVPEPIVVDILESARAEGIRLLDCAAAYGNAEEVLGRCLAHVGPGASTFEIVTKLPPGVRDQGRAGVESSVARSCDRLQVPVVDVLAHDARDLSRDGGAKVLDALRSLRDRSLVRRIGVSVYDAQDIDSVLELFLPDIVQLPLNVVDQRLLRSGHVEELRRRGVAVHVRSAFLQGLLLMRESQLPAWTAPWAPVLRAWQAAVEESGVDPAIAALAFLDQQPAVDIAIVGVKTVAQLETALRATSSTCQLPWDSFAVADPELVEPRHWPSTA